MKRNESKKLQTENCIHTNTHIVQTHKMALIKKNKKQKIGTLENKEKENEIK